MTRANEARIADLKQQIKALEKANVLTETGVEVGDVFHHAKTGETFIVESFDDSKGRIIAVGQTTKTESVDVFELVNTWSKVDAK